MNNNSFNIRIRKDVVGFLKKINLFKLDNYFPEDHYLDAVKEISRIGTHEQIYCKICETYSFDIMLSDDSIYQFHKDGDSYRYCFIQNPKVKYSWEEYLHNNDLKEDELTEEDSNIYRSCYDNNEDDSFRYVENPMYIRYDVSGEEYCECSHPYSHLHIGLHNELRIPVSIVLTPEQFTEFSIKMTYRELWKEMYEKGEISEFHKQVKRGCESVDERYWSEEDRLDLFLV